MFGVRVMTRVMPGISQWGRGGGGGGGLLAGISQVCSHHNSRS